MKYEIQGTPFPVVICYLEKGEKMISDSGAMAWMDPCMKMETSSGGIGKAFGRMFSGETMFLNIYEATEAGKIAFGSSFPGEIKKYDIAPGQEIVVQKSSVLVCEESVERSVFFNKKVSTGLFGGEGFVMSRLSGQGVAFIEIDGATIEYQLNPGEQIIVDSGNLALMDATCQLATQSVPGMKNKLLGGEGFFNTVITGPGRVVLQTMPISTVAKSIIPFIPTGK
ncbi:AIM24 family protein [Allocoprobacillus halotolerans]|uniref:AIM24 family protein n=1 Tax=Allocoprobacillus halotolerans TaxID=2944914 RepID=A0ABY5HYS7_9FIRM|nr:AIM24 family protein [Allocoprobacillus halotolerans]UTY38243.1 AIM24 family protein [Allocoprobacillus halotolerans]